MRLVITILLLFKTFLFGQVSKTFNIEMLNERNYPMKIDTNGVYHITISDKQQSIFKMKATTNSPSTERITWRTKEKHQWSDGIKTDFTPSSIRQVTRKMVSVILWLDLYLK